jgi:uncharacterized membrane protein YkvA (DUF1232 family)
MSELDARYLEVFTAWLRSLPEDAQAFAALLADESAPVLARSLAARGLSYLVKSLDLIQDGIEDLGFIDDALVLRLLAADALSALALAAEGDEAAVSDESSLPTSSVLETLAGDVALIEEFLGPDFARLMRYVSTLDPISTRGRSVEQILGDATVLDQLCSEVRAWADRYEAPAFSRDPKNLVKLRAFLKTKLPA